MASTMAVVKVDSQRRVYIPRELSFDAERVIIIPQGSVYLLIPVPKDVIEIDVSKSLDELKRIAEEGAKADAIGRAKRPKHI